MWWRRAGRELATFVGGILLAPVLVIVAAAIIGTTFLGLAGWTTSWDEDPATMRETKDRLALVETSFDALRVEGHRGTVERLGCRTSSGDLFQPSFDLRWRTDPDIAKTEANRVRSELVAAGWRELPTGVGFPHVDLERDFGGWTARAYLGWTDPEQPRIGPEPGIVLEVRIVSARPCTA